MVLVLGVSGFSTVSGAFENAFPRLWKMSIVLKMAFWKAQTAKSIFVLGFFILPEANNKFRNIVLFSWPPHTNSGFYMVKSAMRLINSGSGTALDAV
jgi:hypothetical protein